MTEKLPYTLQGRRVWLPLLIAAGLLPLIYFSGWNKELFLSLHSLLRFKGSDILWEVLTFCGDAGVTPLFMILFIRRRPDLVWATLWASIVAYLVSHGIKPVVNELRPPAVIEHLDILGPHLKYGSFPSGHSTTIFTLVGLLTLGLPTTSTRTALCWLFGILVGLSRIAVGVHWPIDVLAGLIIGWGSAWFGLWCVGRTHRPGTRFYSIPVVVLFLLIVFNAFGRPYGFDQLYWVQKWVAFLACLLWLKEVYAVTHEVKDRI